MAETDFLEYANPTRITWTVATQSNKAAALNFPRSVPFILGSNPPPPTLAAAPHPLFLLSPLNIYAGGQVGSNLGKMGGGWWNEMGRGGGEEEDFQGGGSGRNKKKFATPQNPATWNS